MEKSKIIEKYNGTFIGELLVSGGFVSSEDIRKAINKQKVTNKKIGELLVEQGLLDPFELNIALEIQDKLRNPKSALKLSGGIKKRLGEILIDAKKITQKQLEEALKLQEKTNLKLGEILIKLGYINPSDLDIALLFQEFSDKPVPNTLKIGEILLKAKIVTKEQLENALETQKFFPEKKIGQILLELGYIDKNKLEWGLNLQQKLIVLTLTGLFSITNLFSIKIAEALEKYSPQNASTKVNVYAHLKAFARINIKEHLSTINITNDDINIGFKEVPSAINFEIKTNTPNVLLSIENNCNDFYESADLIIGGTKTKIGPLGTVIVLKNIGKSYNSDINFRFYLKKDIKPGIYQLPFTLTVEGI